MFVYINEAHAVDVWPIGESAGTLNYSHKTIQDRLQCANKFKTAFDFPITTYLDNMSNDVQNVLASWPFRYFLINFDQSVGAYVFDKIGQPDDAEFNLTEVLI